MIATFTALLSFAAGSQKWVREGFEELGLFNSMNVFPLDPEDAERDSVEAKPLDMAAISKLEAIPGVRYAFPFEDFQVTAETAFQTHVVRRIDIDPRSQITGRVDAPTRFFNLHLIRHLDVQHQLAVIHQRQSRIHRLRGEQHADTPVDVDATQAVFRP